MNEVEQHLTKLSLFLSRKDVMANIIPGVDELIRKSRDLLIQQNTRIDALEREQKQSQEWAQKNVDQNKGFRTDIENLALRTEAIDKEMGLALREIQSLKDRVNDLENNAPSS